MSATYFISCGTKSAKRAENPCPSRKYLASTAIYRLYTFCCQFARGFFRISDKKLFCIKALFRPVLLSRFSTVKVKLFHEKLSQLHKLQGGGAEKAVCCFSADSLLGKQNDLKCPPLRSGHHQRKNYFKFRDIGTPAGVPISHFHERGICEAKTERVFPRLNSPSLAFARQPPLGWGLWHGALFPTKVQSVRVRQRLPPRGSWQNRQVLTEGVRS